MNQILLFSDTEPGGIGTCDWDGEHKWYDVCDQPENNSFDEEEGGYGADSEDSDEDDSDVDGPITTFPYPWLSKLVVTNNNTPVAIVHKKPVEKVLMYNDRPMAVFYHRYSSILEETTQEQAIRASRKRRQPLRLTITPHAFPSTASTHTKVDTYSSAASIRTTKELSDEQHVIKIDDTFDSDVSEEYSPPRPDEETSQLVPFEHKNNGYHDPLGSPHVIGSEDEYSVISLSSGDDSVICLSSDDDDSDCDSVISLSSTESDSVIFVGSTTLKRPREETKKSKKGRESKRVRYDPGLDTSTLQSYLPLDVNYDYPGYHAVRNSRHPGVFSEYSVALNHCTRPDDVHSFFDLREAAFFLERRPKLFQSTQRQHHNARGKPVFEVYCDGSSKRGPDGNQVGGFGVWFGHYHPDNVAGPLTGELQDPLQGELRALQEAYKVLYNRHDDNLYTIYCDCYGVVRNINAGKNFQQKYHSVVTSIQLYKRLLGTKVLLQHVMGHCGHPGNERADILAKMGRVQREGSIYCMNAIMEDRYRRTIGEDPDYPFNGHKLDYLLDRDHYAPPSMNGHGRRRA